MYGVKADNINPQNELKQIAEQTIAAMNPTAGDEL